MSFNAPPALREVYSREAVLQERLDTVDQYLYDLQPPEYAAATGISAQLRRSAVPLPETVVVMPVAAHTEAANILPALLQYSRQTGCKPFAVHLHLNYPPAEAGSTGVQASHRAITMASKAFTGLDLRVSEATYHPDISTIGSIRRVAWNGTLRALAQSTPGAVSQAIGINHDIDLKRMTRHFVANVQREYQQLDGRDEPPSYLPVRQTQGKHYASPAHPNTSRAVFWSDFMARVNLDGFEAGIAIPLASYALYDGFVNGLRTYEVHSFANRTAQAVTVIDGTSNGTPMRRYIARMPRHGYDIWSDDSFGADDDCRTNATFPDITTEQMETLVTETIPNFVHNHYYKILSARLDRSYTHALTSPHKAQAEAAHNTLVSRLVRVSKQARFILRRTLAMPEAAALAAQSGFNGTDIAIAVTARRMQLLQDMLERQLEADVRSVTWSQHRQHMFDKRIDRFKECASQLEALHTLAD